MTEARRTLIVYATRRGSTQSVAERIAARLRAGGQDVELLPVDRVEDVAAYDAIVLGSPVLNGSWTPEALEFARREAAALAARPVWLFSVGSFSDRRPIVGALARRQPREIAELTAALRPRGYRVFAGVVDAKSWPLYGRLLLRALGGRAGDDRDWPDIDAWADEIGAALTL